MCKRMLHLLKHNKLNYRPLYLKERLVCNKFLTPSIQVARKLLQGWLVYSWSEPLPFRIMSILALSMSSVVGHEFYHETQGADYGHQFLRWQQEGTGCLKSFNSPVPYIFLFILYISSPVFDYFQQLRILKIFPFSLYLECKEWQSYIPLYYIDEHFSLSHIFFLYRNEVPMKTLLN